ncbi:MAG: hypothetical protein NC043_09235 [Muribaculaceae bacterium]|nr:hypothetical protein [Muribaculaceae bacterium]
MKTHTVTIGATAPTLDCADLLPASLPGAETALRLTMLPTAVSTHSLHPFHHFTHPSGAESVFYWRPSDTPGCEADIVVERMSEFFHVASLSAVPFCAVNAPAEVIAMLPDGPHRFIPDDDEVSWAHISPTAVIPMPVITPRMQGSLSDATARLAISTDISSLTDSAVILLSHSLLEAYAGINARAAASGFWMQPALFITRTLDSSGGVIAESPAVLMSASGWQCAGEVEASVVESGFIPSLSLRADVYTLDVRLPASPDPAAAVVEILEMPLLHPADSDARAPWRVYSSGSTRRFAAALPGATASLSSLDASRARTLADIAAYGAAAGRVIARLDPVAQAGQTVSVKRTAAGDVYHEMALTSATLASSPQPSAVRSASTFTAHHVAVSGNTVLWADVERIFSAGFTPELWGAEFAQGSGTWTGAVITEIPHRGRRVERFTCSGPRPTSLSPLISYPDKRVTSITVMTADAYGSGVTSATIGLSPDPAGTDFAVYVNPALASTPLRPVDVSMPEPSGIFAERTPSRLRAAPAASPLGCIGTLDCSMAPVTALAPAAGHSSLDMTRVHFYAFTRSGTMSVTVRSRSGDMSSSLIDPRGVLSQQAVAVAPQAVYALSGGSILRFTRTSVTTHVTDAFGAVMLAWSPPDGTLWTLDAQGNARSYLIDGHGLCSRYTPWQPHSLYAASDRLLLGTDSGLLSLSAQDTSSATALIPVKWAVKVLTPAAMRPMWLSVDISASCFNGTVRVLVPDGLSPGSMYPVSVFSLTGGIHAPLLALLRAPLRRHLVIELSGQASPDFILRNASVRYYGHKH